MIKNAHSSNTPLSDVYGTMVSSTGTYTLKYSGIYPANFNFNNLDIEKKYLKYFARYSDKEKAFLPGYVLIEAALVGEVSHVIKGIPNVIGFLGTVKGGEPVPMRLSEVNRILGKVDELAENEEELKIPFVIGESVKVIDGPFNNFSGVIDEINEDKKKLKVMVKIFGRKNLLELSYMQVEKEG